MSKQKFYAGDLVQIKSGGPKMTVESVRDNDGDFRYYCTWFSGAKHNKNSFSEEAIEKSKDNK